MAQESRNLYRKTQGKIIGNQVRNGLLFWRCSMGVRRVVPGELCCVPGGVWTLVPGMHRLIGNAWLCADWVEDAGLWRMGWKRRNGVG